MAGQVAGGVLAAPLAGFVVRMIPPQKLMMLVGSLVMALAIFQTWQLLS